MPTIGGINLGNLTDYLFVFTDGNVDANWQGASKGYLGDVGVDGLVASERTSGFVPYAGTIFTNASTLGAWQAIVTDNPGQAFGVPDQVARIAGLEADLTNAFTEINALPPTPGFESVSALSLNGLNTQNGVNETYVINVTSGFSVTSQILITGDPGDVYVLRWDNAPLTPGYQGQVMFSSGGAIVPQGGLTPANFIHVAGDINSSGGGTNPPPPYPQGPRYDNGQGALINGGSDWNGGGFFTGYWLTTGDPSTGATQPLSNGIFVGGWYTTTTKFSMTSGTSGVHITPNPATVSTPAITLEKLLSVDNGATFQHAETPPGPTLIAPTNPQYRFVVTNTGNVTLTNITLVDTTLGPIPTPTTLPPGASFTTTVPGTFRAGEQCNAATVTGTFGTQTVAAADTACYFGAQPSIALEKLVSVDNGVTFQPAPAPPGPNLAAPTNPQFEYVITNTGNVTLDGLTLVDSALGPITLPTTTLAPGASVTGTAIGTFAAGQQCNTAGASGTFETATVTATDSACYTGVTVPSIAIEKAVSVDGGTSFVYPAPAPGPTLIGPTNPVYRITVTNNGSVTLNNVTVVDTVLGPITVPTTTLTPGASFVVQVTGTFAPGEQCDTATASGTYVTGTVTAADTACYTGTEAACTVTGYQEVCVDADIAIQATATPGTPIVACLTTPSIHPFGTRTCVPTGTRCGFSTQVVLCVAVPVSFGATATTAAVVQECTAPSATSCLPPP